MSSCKIPTDIGFGKIHFQKKKKLNALSCNQEKSLFPFSYHEIKATGYCIQSYCISFKKIGQLCTNISLLSFLKFPEVYDGLLLSTVVFSFIKHKPSKEITLMGSSWGQPMFSPNMPHLFCRQNNDSLACLCSLPSYCF